MPNPVRSSPALRLLRLLLAGMILVVAGCEGVVPSPFSSDIADLLSRGEDYAHALVERPDSVLTDEDIVALGYLERARLGIGSPFRLISYVRRDERLEPETRDLLPYALFNLTLRQEGYQVDPAVLEVLQLIGGPTRAGLGRYHLNLIERTVMDAPSATSGERAARFGYLLAGTERTLTAAPEPVVAYVAAMVADRRRARHDAVELLRTASRLQEDPLELLDLWRRDLHFRVEAPAMFAVPALDEAVEARRGAQLATSLRTMAQRLSTPGVTLARSHRQDFWRESWLSRRSATRLLSLAEEQDYPPQAPIAVAVMINRDALVSRPGLTSGQMEQRGRFTDYSVNEEKLTAAAAHLANYRADRGPRLSLILLQSAVFMRGWNQEEPWFPGDPAPSSRDLESRFGLASVSFDAGVKDTWRPYYRRMLGRGLSDLQRVLPTASVRGMSVRFSSEPVEGGALALHEPRTRTLILPIGSGAGTLAHEIAHDLDWQLARKRYNLRGGYASDLAINRQKGDRLAASLAGLTASFLRDFGDGAVTEHDRRPAEVFARGMDWLVAAHLAGEGRTGGYITSYQDVAIAGYGTTRGPQVGGAAVPSLLGILDQIAPVTPEARQWATDTYGPSRTLTAKELVRAITTANPDGEPYDRFEALESAHNRALEGLSSASCRMVPSSEARRLFAARLHAARAGVEAAGRGIVIDGVRRVASQLAEPPSSAAVDQLLLWRLDGGPEPADTSVLLLQPVADELMLRSTTVASPPSVATRGFELSLDRALCGGNPFAYERLWRQETWFSSSRHPQ